jgi:hypothetical protein
MHSIHSEPEPRPLDRAARADEHEVFLDLVEGKALARIAARAGRLGFDLARPHTPLACRADRRTGCVRINRGVARLEDTVRATFDACFPGGGHRPLIGGIGQHELLAFLPTSDPLLIERVGDAIVRRATALGEPVTVGTGPSCQAPETFSENAKRARWTAEILEWVDGSRRVASFEELGVYALLFNADRPGELEQFMRRWIGVLIDYDEHRKADLTLTLGALLEGRGLRQAAQQLVIHVSTLKYRIKRINEILALDYHDPEIAFNLQLAVRLFKITRLIGDGPACPGGGW